MEEKQKLPWWAKILIVCGVIFGLMMIALIAVVMIFAFKVYQPREKVAFSQIETFFSANAAEYEISEMDICTAIETDGLAMWVFHEDDEDETYGKIVEWKEENLGEFWGFFSGSAHQEGKNYEVSREFDFGGDGICLIEVEEQLIYIITTNEDGMNLQKEFLKEFNFSFFPKKED